MRIANFDGTSFDVIHNETFTLRGTIFTRDGNQHVRFRNNEGQVVHEEITPQHNQLGQIAIEKIAHRLTEEV